jgi:hypothetical protein
MATDGKNVIHGDTGAGPSCGFVARFPTRERSGFRPDGLGIGVAFFAGDPTQALRVAIHGEGKGVLAAEDGCCHRV